MERSDWNGLYREGWRSTIVKPAFAHPAKFSRGLIRRIYDHCAECGWLRAGDAVLDPFGGVALGALEALRLGLRWTGVEVEPRFVELGRANIALWNATYGAALPRWGTARLLQGDSRDLLAVLGERGAAASAPARYDRAAFSAAIASPPFRQTSGGTNQTHLTGPLADSALLGRHGAGNAAAQAYGVRDGQLANLDDGDFAAALSSPPYENVMRSSSSGIDWEQATKDGRLTPARLRARLKHHNGRVYGSEAGQLGRHRGDTFWSAARAIVDQTCAALRPGGHAIWVVKGFVRRGRLVDFPDQWRQLCEAAGFTTLHLHRAWVVEDHGTQLSTDESLRGHQPRRVERKSFFRRLCEKKGAPRIDFETVICQVRRDSGGRSDA